MTVALLNVGDELLVGQVVNTHAAWLGEQLAAHGFAVARSIAVGDDGGEIAWALGQLLAVADAVICTGGLGTTHDDVTVSGVARALGRPLRRHAGVERALRAYYRQRGRRLPAGALRMADVPEGFEPIANPVGAAPGLWFEGAIEHFGARAVAVLPSIPQEMKGMMRTAVMPRLMQLRGEEAAAQRTLLTVGLGEASVVARLGDLEPWLAQGLKLSVLPNYGQVRLRATATGATRPEAEQQVEAFLQFARQRLSDLVFGEGEVSLGEAVGGLLRQRGLTLALAESCTGGALGAELTDVPGSSAYFLGGVIAYSNESKVQLLAVAPDALRRQGAVSEAVALQMAAGARARFGADMGVAITGVAGPGGGSPSTPVGTVWLALADAGGTLAVRHHFGGDRLTVKRLSVSAALDLVRRRVLRAEG